MGDKPRIMRPDLCVGALLDLGVYALNFVRMFAVSDDGADGVRSTDIETIDGYCVKSATGMDLTNAIPSS